MAEKGVEAKQSTHMKTIILLIIPLITNCGSNSETQVDRISCNQMRVLEQQGLLPATIAEQNTLRILFAQTIADELALGQVQTPMPFCNY